MYRVEAFIVPRTISDDGLSTSNEIDDVKVAKLGSPLKNIEVTCSRSSVEAVEDMSRNICVKEEPIYDVPCPLKRRVPEIPPSQYKYEDTAAALVSIAPKIPVRTSSLVSIDERGECDGIIEEFCFHGNKNGCTASKQSPEQVSEEIFQNNWLRRLESLRERETLLGEREMLLQERERLLFKKERELRILERLLRDKLKKVEQQLSDDKRCQSSQSVESTNFDAKTRSSEGSLNSHRTKLSSRNCDMKFSTNCGPDDDRIRDALMDNEKMSRLLGSTSDGSEKGSSKLTVPPNTRNSSWITSSTSSTSTIATLAKEHLVRPLGHVDQISHPSLGTYSSLRMGKPKIRPKISYDDLDSTLSADIGDSSYVVTSRKFDPAIFKKPHAFTRSASERRPRNDNRDSIFKLPQHPASRNPPEEIKKRESIIVTQQKDTNEIKYQDYGPIDEIVADNKESRNSCPNLERRTVIDIARSESIRKINSRPISWNEENNEWLRKKRQAYNMATLKISTETSDNKENAGNTRDKSKKVAKKKESKIKKFGIFR